MKAWIRVTTAALAVAALGGCAMWNSMGFGHRHDAAPTAEAQAACDAAVETLRGKPDYDTALRACLDEKARRPYTH